MSANRRNVRLAALIAAAGWRAGLEPDQIARGLGCSPRHARRLLAVAAESAREILGAGPGPVEAPLDLDDEPPRRQPIQQAG